MAYKLELPMNTSIGNVFRVSQLKKVLGPTTSLQSQPPLFSEDFEWQEEPKDVLGLQNNLHTFLDEWLVH